MVTCTVRVSEKYAQSEYVSIQQEHVELYTRGQLFSILLCHRDNSLIHEYKDLELARLIGSALSRGRRRGTNSFTGETEFYFLGDR